MKNTEQRSNRMDREEARSQIDVVVQPLRADLLSDKQVEFIQLLQELTREGASHVEHLWLQMGAMGLPSNLGSLGNRSDNVHSAVQQLSLRLGSGSLQGLEPYWADKNAPWLTDQQQLLPTTNGKMASRRPGVSYGEFAGSLSTSVHRIGQAPTVLYRIGSLPPKPVEDPLGRERGGTTYPISLAGSSRLDAGKQAVWENTILNSRTPLSSPATRSLDADGMRYWSNSSHPIILQQLRRNVISLNQGLPAGYWNRAAAIVSPDLVGQVINMLQREGSSYHSFAAAPAGTDEPGVFFGRNTLYYLSAHMSARPLLKGLPDFPAQRQAALNEVFRAVLEAARDDAKKKLSNRAALAAASKEAIAQLQRRAYAESTEGTGKAILEPSKPLQSTFMSAAQRTFLIDRNSTQVADRLIRNELGLRQRLTSTPILFNDRIGYTELEPSRLGGVQIHASMEPSASRLPSIPKATSLTLDTYVWTLLKDRQLFTKPVTALSPSSHPQTASGVNTVFVDVMLRRMQPEAAAIGYSGMGSTHSSDAIQHKRQTQSVAQQASDWAAAPIDIRWLKQPSEPAPAAPPAPITQQVPQLELSQLEELIKELPQLDIRKIADKVYQEIEKKMKFERQRRGF